MRQPERSDCAATPPGILAGRSKRLKLRTAIDATAGFLLILLLGFTVLHCTGSSKIIVNDPAPNAGQPQTRTQNAHAWPESIDVDRRDNLYFTDAYEGKLYRIARNEDGRLRPAEEVLVEGLVRASGISISREEDVLYMGLALKTDAGTEYKIARIPLDALTACDCHPCSYDALNACARKLQLEMVEYPICYAPNGVIYNPDSRTVYYTHEALGAFSWLFKTKGHIGSVSVDNPAEEKIISSLYSPNGIDVAPYRGGQALIVSITLENGIDRIILSDNEVTAISPFSLEKAESGIFGNLPDGLLRLPDGDLLVAAFGSGKVFYLPQQENGYGDPVELVQGLGNPTDLTIGLSGNGSGNSLYVTTKDGGILPWRWIAKGRVIEIPDIEKIINTAKSR